MFDCVLFDLDGTLTDFKEGITKSVQFAPGGIFESKVYPGIPRMLEHLRAAGMKLAVVSSKPEVYVKQILEHFQLDSYFDVVAGSNLDGTGTDKGEAVEEGLRQLKKLFPGRELDKITYAMIGSRGLDIQEAREHGLMAIGVTYGYAGKGELEKAAPDYLVRTVKQLEEVLLQGGGFQKEQEKERLQSAPLFQKTLDILNPILIYYVVRYISAMLLSFLSLFFCQLSQDMEVWVRQNRELQTHLITACSMMIGAGVLLPVFLKEERKRQLTRQVAAGWLKRKLSLLRQGILAGTGALGINILFSLLHITQIASYEETAQIQYQLPFFLGLLIYGVISPFAEELVFRGLVYFRMKRYVSVPMAMAASSCLFGIYHGNLVQTFYGTLLAMLIVYLYEQTGSFFTAVFAHGIANAVVFSCTYDARIGAAIGTWANCGAFLFVFFMMLYQVERTRRV